MTDIQSRLDAHLAELQRTIGHDVRLAYNRIFGYYVMMDSRYSVPSGWRLIDTRPGRRLFKTPVIDSLEAPND